MSQGEAQVTWRHPDGVQAVTASPRRHESSTAQRGSPASGASPPALDHLEFRARLWAVIAEIL